MAAFMGVEAGFFVPACCFVLFVLLKLVNRVRVRTFNVFVVNLGWSSWGVGDERMARRDAWLTAQASSPATALIASPLLPHPLHRCCHAPW